MIYFLTIILIFISAGLASSLSLLKFSKHSENGNLEKYSHLGYVWFSFALLFQKEGAELLRDHYEFLIYLFIVSTVFYGSKVLKSFGLDDLVFHTFNKKIKRISWNDLKSGFYIKSLGRENVSGEYTSSFDDIITIDVDFIHPHTIGWYYLMYDKIVFVEEGEMEFEFKESGRVIKLKKHQSIRISRKEIHKFKTHRNSKVRLVCIKSE